MEDLDHFKKSHKALAFTCRLSGCARSTIGFENDRLRTEHEQSHVSRIFCEYAGCQYPSFSSARALRSHTTKWHDQALQEKPKRSIRAQKIPKPAQDRRPRSGSAAPSPSQLITPDAHSLPSKASSKAVPLSNWRPTRPYGSSTESIDYSDRMEFEELHPTSSELSFVQPMESSSSGNFKFLNSPKPRNSHIPDNRIGHLTAEKLFADLPSFRPQWEMAETGSIREVSRGAHPSPNETSTIVEAPPSIGEAPTQDSLNQTQGNKSSHKPNIGNPYEPNTLAAAALRHFLQESQRDSTPDTTGILPPSPNSPR